MIIYQGQTGRVEKGLLTGFRFHLSTGHVVRATPWMKHRMGELHFALKARGLDAAKDQQVNAAFWEYFLELAHSPADGLAHRAEAATPVGEVVDYIQRDVTSER